jgi:hypothetical protein
MLMLYFSGSFNDAQALEHNNLDFRSSDVISVGGLYFSYVRLRSSFAKY